MEDAGTNERASLGRSVACLQWQAMWGISVHIDCHGVKAHGRSILVVMMRTGRATLILSNSQ